MNQINFDPMTGQPINQQQNNNSTLSNSQSQNSSQVIPQTNVAQVPVETQIMQVQPTINQQTFQNQMQSIPTVEQSKQEFIDNTQAINTQKSEKKKTDSNYAFIIILFIIIFAAIFFLFPYLLNYI